MATDITEDVDPRCGLPMGLVDVKVCAVDADLVRAQAGDPQGAALKRGTMKASIWKPTLIATLVCGILDAIYPTALTLLRGRDPAGCGAAWPPARSPEQAMGHGGIAARARNALCPDGDHGGRVHAGRARTALPARSAVARRPGLRPHHLCRDEPGSSFRCALERRSHRRPCQIVSQLFAHIVLVGWPTAFIARRYLRG